MFPARHSTVLSVYYHCTELHNTLLYSLLKKTCIDITLHNTVPYSLLTNTVFLFTTQCFDVRYKTMYCTAQHCTTLSGNCTQESQQYDSASSVNFTPPTLKQSLKARLLISQLHTVNTVKCTLCYN